VQTVLDDAAAGRIRPAPRKHRKAKGPPPRYSRQSLVHIRAVLVRVMGDAMRDELIDVNRAALSTVPDSAPRDGRPRAVLLDDEIAALLACPSVDVEIKMLVLVSRTVGGLRAGDLNALDWQAFGPGFATLTFIRSKTKKKRPMPETHEVPADARTWLEAWHTAHGSPEAGAVFPVRRGPRAGATKAEASHGYARKLRKALLKAGITRPELHRKDLPTTRRVDFHSTRRAYATAVGDHAQALEAAALIGHASPVMTMGYQDRTRVRVLPGAAVPVLPPAPTNLATRRVQNQKAK
jgi:integrase